MNISTVVVHTLTDGISVSIVYSSMVYLIMSKCIRTQTRGRARYPTRAED